MASYGATVLGRVKKKKDTDDTVSKRKKLINSSMGLDTVKPKVGDATKYPSVSQRGPTIRTNTNTTANTRAGQKYAVIQTSRGVIHDYGKGKRVLIKKENPPRAFHSKITEDDPRWNARTMGNKTGWHKGTYYKNGKAVKKMPIPGRTS